MFLDHRYKKKHWNKVIHTTFNPKGPGVIRIHMIPPKQSAGSHAPAVVILNGQELLPLNESWAILLTEFIEQVNAHGPGEISDAEMDGILTRTYKGVKKVYPNVPIRYLEEDLDTIIQVFEAIINQDELPIEVGAMNIGQYAPKMKAPHRMDLMVSAMEQNGHWNCNQQCVHCYAAGQPLSNQQELSTEKWKQIIDKCQKAMIPQLTFTGGEPTMRDDLPELIYAARWFVTRLNTNGIRLTPEYCEDLVRAELDSVQVTFYSCDREIHNTLVGGNHFDQTVQGIKNALAAGLNLSANTPLCTLNKEYVKTLEFLYDLGVTYVTCSGLIISGNATKEQSVSTRLDKQEMKDILKEATEYCYTHGMEINFTSPGWVDGASLNAIGLDAPICGACLSNMAITPNGKVVPCQSYLSEKPLGDMLKSEWQQIWNSQPCRTMRKESAKMQETCPLYEKNANASKEVEA